MKKYWLLFICCFSLYNCVWAQAQVKHLKESDRKSVHAFACNFFDQNVRYFPPDPSTVSDADAELWMRSMINDITGKIGIQNRFRVLALHDYNNCSAICFSNDVGQDRFIQFDKQFLEKFQKRTKNPWFTMGVLAHELGHHLNGHSLDGVGSRPNKEIEADEFAGFILQKMGANLNQAQGIFSFMNETEGPPTHPIKRKRYEAIKRGWDKAAGKISLATLMFNDADMVNAAVNNLVKARKEKDLNKRLALIHLALTDFPDYAEALSEKGLVFMQQEKYDSAFYYCNKAVLIEPYIGLLRLNMAKVFYYKKEMETSKAFLDDALYCRPVFPEAYLFMASTAFDKLDYADALYQTDIALKMNPETDELRADILAAHAIALYKLQRYQEALTYIDAAKKLDAGNIRVMILYDMYKAKAEATLK
ncbi:MAG: tetratricopeptide repeat protein [Ferruginibacter sp.]